MLERPTVIYFHADNLGYGELGCYGGGILPGADTRRIDQFATEGAPLVFDGSIGSLIENAAHLTFAFRRTLAAVDAGRLFFSQACPYPRDEILGGGQTWLPWRPLRQ